MAGEVVNNNGGQREKNMTRQSVSVLERILQETL